MCHAAYVVQVLFIALNVMNKSSGYSTITRERSLVRSSTTTAPPRTDRRTGSRTTDKGKNDWISPSSPSKISDKLEYLSDDKSISRLDDDPFHIVLLGETFSDERPRITVTYVASSMEYVLGMPFDTSLEHADFAKDNGISCLGTWSREECLNLGSQLLVRDIVCRVVPFCEGSGSSSGWQAKDVTNSNIFE